MSDVLLRNLKLLQAIPRAPRKADVSRLHGILTNAGYDITRRQVQRDLNTLSGMFPIQADERGSAYGWSWEKNAALLDLPGMDARTALMLKLVQKFIPELLPPGVSDELRPYFTRADEMLKREPAGNLGRWTEFVRVLPREMPLLAPKFDKEAVRVVYDALLNGRRFTARYASRSAGENAPKDYEINPLGLVVRGNLLYLVCTLWNYEDVRHLALHRLSKAKPLEQEATRPKGFNLDEHIRQGEFQIPEGDDIVLNVIFDRASALHLRETPLSADQEIKDLDKDRVRVTATVRDTQQLEWWLRAFGDAAEVVSPKGLRERMRVALSRAADLYNK